MTGRFVPRRRPTLIITNEELKQIMPKLSPAKRTLYLPFLNRVMEEYEINTPLRSAAFLAQLAHESGEFRYMEELGGRPRPRKDTNRQAPSRRSLAILSLATESGSRGAARSRSPGDPTTIGMASCSGSISSPIRNWRPRHRSPSRSPVSTGRRTASISSPTGMISSPSPNESMAE